MKWKNKLPDKSGYYWMLDIGSGEISIEYVQENKSGFCIDNGGELFYIDSSCYRYIKWCYIPEPK